jgi:hypothetical protein
MRGRLTEREGGDRRDRRGGAQEGRSQEGRYRNRSQGEEEKGEGESRRRRRRRRREKEVGRSCSISKL